MLETNILVAPLCGVSDLPFRTIIRKYTSGLIFTEMVKMEGLLRTDSATFRLLDYSPQNHPIGAQLCGSVPAYAKSAAKIVEELGFDVVDLNCGCPVDKVTNDGSGSGLLKTPQRIAEIIYAMVSSVSIPVTVKVRAGWDDKSIIIEELVQLAEQAGASCITVHGRTRKQAYMGKVQYQWIKRAVEAAKKIPVIGNGDIFTPQDAKRMFDETGCAGIMVARGAIARPCLVSDIEKYFQEGIIPSQTREDRKQVLLDFFQTTSSYATDQRALVEMKRVCCSYIGGEKDASSFREAFARCKNISEIKDLIERLYTEEE